jgi:hypothetical protein
VQAVFDRDGHELVVDGVVLDLVDAVAVAVVGAQDGWVRVGEPAPLLGLLAAGQPAERVDLVDRPGGAVPGQRLEQRRIVTHVVADEWGNLVRHRVRSHTWMLHFLNTRR